MEKGCLREIEKLEDVLQRKLNKMERDLFEFAFDKGFKRGRKDYAFELLFDNEEM